MGITGIVHHPLCQEHFAGPGHPERPERLQSVLGALRSAPELEACAWLEAPAATLDWIGAVHAPDLAPSVRAACARGRALLDGGDTYVSSESYDAALRAAGGAVEACARVLRGEWSNAFVAVRPPGHHAEESTAMGFCLFNNVAIAARWLRGQGLARVAVLDWDVHHGNGTQHIFERDPSVFYASLHQFPHYPGTGAAGERGLGEGLGATVNCPLASGTGDREWLAALEGTILRELESFQPDFVLVSAGFDAHRDDPLSGTEVTTEGFRAMSASVLAFAAQSAKGRVVSVLEGGYHLDALARSSRIHVAELTRASY